LELIIIIVIVIFIYYLYDNDNDSYRDNNSASKYQPKPSSEVNVNSAKTNSQNKNNPKKKSNSKTYPKNSFGIIQKCIDEESDIYFTYKREDGEISSRRVTPEVLYWGNREITKNGKKERVCYLDGYCHLRDEDRTFILDRMTDLKKL